MKNKKLSEEYGSDLWTRRFVDALCDLYGVPSSTLECYNRSDKVMFTWAMLHIAKALKTYPDLWKNKKDIPPIEVAEAFARSVYDESGEMVLPNIPPPPEMTGMSPKETCDL